jgi:hypothetical protein
MSLLISGMMSPRELPDSRLQSLSSEQDHQLCGAIYFERECTLIASCQHTTHAEKNGGRRALFPLKRANISAFLACVIAQLVRGGTQGNVSRQLAVVLVLVIVRCSG